MRSHLVIQTERFRTPWTLCGRWKSGCQRQLLAVNRTSTSSDLTDGPRRRAKPGGRKAPWGGGSTTKFGLSSVSHRDARDVSFTGVRLRRTDARISSVTVYSHCQARHGLGPRGVPASLANARYRLLPAGGTSPSALSQDKLFGIQHVQGQHHLLPLHLASSRDYASIGPLPARLQVSIPGPRLTAT